MKRVAMGLMALVLAVAVGHARQVPTDVFTTYVGEMTTQKNDLPPLNAKHSVRVDVVRAPNGGTVQLVLKGYKLPSYRVLLAPIALNNITLGSMGEDGKWLLVQQSAQEGVFPSADKKMEAYLTVWVVGDTGQSFLTEDGHLELELRILFGETLFTHRFEGKRMGATGISHATLQPNDAEAVYHDLQGRRVSRPGRGIYIVGGKKVVR